MQWQQKETIVNAFFDFIGVDVKMLRREGEGRCVCACVCACGFGWVGGCVGVGVVGCDVGVLTSSILLRKCWLLT